MNTTKTAAVITTLAIAFGGAVVPMAEAQTHTLKQGDRISIKKENGSRVNCTVGYVDEARKLLFTAAHCVNDKNAEVYLSDRTTYLGKPILVGDWGTSWSSNDENDYAAIDYSKAEGVVGSNPYSTKLANKEDIVRGKRVCSYGAKTPEVRCAEIAQVDDYGPNKAMILVESSTQFAQLGDSGSPLWLEDTGEFIGTLSGNGHQFTTATFLPRHGQRLLDGTEITITETPAPVTTTRTVTPAPVTTTRIVTSTPNPVTTTHVVTATPETVTETNNVTSTARVTETQRVTETERVTATQHVTETKQVTQTVTKEPAPATVTRNNTVTVTAPAETVTETTHTTVTPAPVTVTETVTNDGETVAPVTVTATTTATETVTTTTKENVAPVTVTTTATSNNDRTGVPVTVTKTTTADNNPDPAQSSMSTGSIIGIMLGILAALGIGAGAGAFAVENGMIQLPF